MSTEGQNIDVEGQHDDQGQPTSGTLGTTLGDKWS